MFTPVVNAKTLQDQIIRGFILMGVLIFIVALIGWLGNKGLSSQLDIYSQNTFPTVNNLWKVKDEQSQIQSAERLLLVSSIGPNIRRKELDRIENAWKQIDEALQNYEKVSPDDQEKELYKQFKSVLADWKTQQKQFLELNQEFEQYNIYNPKEIQIQELLVNKKNSPEYNKAVKASEVLKKMTTFLTEQEKPANDRASEALLAVLNHNINLGNDARKTGGIAATASGIWALMALLLGPAIAIGLGIYLSGILIRQVQKSCIAITTSSNQIGASGKELEATVAQQTASTNEVSATAREIAATSKQLVRTMQQVTSLSQETAIAAGNSQDELTDMENIMRTLSEATASIASKLGTMSSKANNINTVVATITKVAVQTNLLSLNAAIEAEKAGEYGAGFSVVAREIRRLADQTAVATLEIEQMVKEMQSAVATGVMEMDKFNNAVSDSVNKVGKISHQISQVIEQVQGLTPRFIEVSQGMEEQSQGAEQINEAMLQLTQASQQTTDAIKETNLALGNLDDAAIKLRSRISRLPKNYE